MKLQKYIDPIKPYKDAIVTTIKWLAIIGLALLLFVSGCSYRASKENIARSTQAAELVECRRANDTYEKAAKEREDVTQENLEKAEQHKKAADEESERIRLERLSFEQRERELEEQLKAMKENGKCADLLAMKVCSNPNSPSLQR